MNELSPLPFQNPNLAENSINPESSDQNMNAALERFLGNNESDKFIETVLNHQRQIEHI